MKIWIRVQPHPFDCNDEIACSDGCGCAPVLVEAFTSEPAEPVSEYDSLKVEVELQEVER